jgi:DNA replication protein DnaC
MQRLQQVSQMGPEDVKRKLSDIGRNSFNFEILDAAQEAIDEAWGWYYFWGGPGNAKSEVLKAIVNECNKNGKGPAMYTSLGRIISYIKAAFHKDATEDSLARFDKLVNTPVLAIDEMDKVNETEWLHEFRFQFLDTRYNSAHNKKTLTIYAGNPNPAEIYDDVLFDRFRDGRWRIVENKAPSARPGLKR